MNSSAGAGNYRRGSAKGDKVTAEALSYSVSVSVSISFPHIRSVFVSPPARKMKSHQGLGGVGVAVMAR